MSQRTIDQAQPVSEFMPHESSLRAWTRADVEAHPDRAFFDLTPTMIREISGAVDELRLRQVTLQTIEQEDFRVPSFATHVPDIRRRLDEEFGLVVIRGLDLSAWSVDEIEMVYWGLGNYIGRVMRQNLRGERLDTVKNRGIQNVTDPYRLIETPVYFQPHTDNGMLEPRPPTYLGLMCVRSADVGGNSILVSAYTIHNTILTEHPEYLPRLYEPFHIEPPIEQRLPGSSGIWSKPVFEWTEPELTIHYIRYLMDPGMEKAGTPLTEEETAILDYIDSVLRREELLFEYHLNAGDILIENNLRNLHGRREFKDKNTGSGGRELRRIWLWRRHGSPGADPVELDHVELGS